MIKYQSEKLKEQTSWINVLKGIGIIFVVLGHFIIPEFLHNYIYSFHMQLFFFISGYLMNLNREMYTIDYICKKVNSLIVPFFIFNFTGIVYWNIRTYIFQNTILPFKKNASELFCLENITGWNEPVWFLLSLFIIEILSYILLNNKSYNMNLIFLLSIIVGIIYNNVEDLPFQIDGAIIGFSFFIFGYIIKDKSIIERLYKKCTFKYVIILLILSIFFSYINGSVNMSVGNLSNSIYTYISAFSGIMLFSLLAYKINKSKILEFIGRNSLFIMLTHYFILDFYRFLGKYILNYDFMHMGNIIIALIMTIVTIIITIPFICFTNRYLPIFVGKCNLKFVIKL